MARTARLGIVTGLIAAFIGWPGIPGTAPAADEMTWSRAPNGEFQITLTGVSDPAKARERMKALAPTRGVEMCKGIANALDSRDCMIAMARVSANPSVCVHFNTPREYAGCLKAVAVDASNPGICGWMDIHRFRDMEPYRETCYGEIAVKTRNIGICERAGKLVANCIEALVARSGDPGICNALKVDMYRESCINDFAVDQNKPALCERHKKDMKSSCYHDMAIVTADASLCRKVSDPGSRNSCLETLSKFQKGTVAGCSELQNGQDRNYCLKRLAIRDGSDVYCDLMETPAGMPRNPAQEKCFTELALAKGDSRLCERIKNHGPAVDRCVGWVAGIKDNVDLCEQVLNADFREQCIARIAIQRGDSRLCERLEDRRMRAVCSENAKKGVKLAPVKPAPVSSAAPKPTPDGRDGRCQPGHVRCHGYCCPPGFQCWDRPALSQAIKGGSCYNPLK